jgi:hypothetical protein
MKNEGVEGVNYDVHDFPSSELGLKLGGFMMLSSVETVGDNQSESDVCDVVDPEDPEFDLDFTN